MYMIFDKIDNYFANLWDVGVPYLMYADEVGTPYNGEFRWYASTKIGTIKGRFDETFNDKRHNSNWKWHFNYGVVPTEADIEALI